MPEYLAPGVYVEEIDTGAKPIEGVSTSTCGMVGVAERGPVDVPVLVTSVGEYARWFGGLLRAGDDYGEPPVPAARDRGLLHQRRQAGLRRARARRVGDQGRSALFDRGDDATAIAPGCSAPRGRAPAPRAAQPSLIALDSTGLVANDWVRVGDGSDAEYHQLLGAPGAETVHGPGRPAAGAHARRRPSRCTTAPGRWRPRSPSQRRPSAATKGSCVRGPNADVDALVNEAQLLAGDIVLEIGAVGAAEFRLAREVSEVTVVSAHQNDGAGSGWTPRSRRPTRRGGVLSRITLGGTGRRQPSPAPWPAAPWCSSTPRAPSSPTPRGWSSSATGRPARCAASGHCPRSRSPPGVAEALDAGTLVEVVALARERKTIGGHARERHRSTLQRGRGRRAGAPGSRSGRRHRLRSPSW